MKQFADKAIELCQQLPENDARSALQLLIRFTVERTH
jgi:geranylgeranyl pyrophosphate synthase